MTVRYFPEKLPIGYERDQYRHVFIYLARSPSPMDFRVFILRHLELFNALGFWTIQCSSRGPSRRPWMHTGTPPANSREAVEPLGN